MEEVAYVYRETREGGFLLTMLKNFKGILVSDFYAAYEAIPCPQKCLIHLIQRRTEAAHIGLCGPADANGGNR
jgi:hypothetical protein